MAILDQPFQLIILLFGLSLLPLFAVMGTSFLKLAIVFAMLRNALGIQQIPPNMAIYGLALVLTLFTMAPIGMAVNDSLEVSPITLDDPQLMSKVDTQVLVPYREFLDRNTSTKQSYFFINVGQKIWPQKYHDILSKESLLVMIPAFALSQLIEAFKIGLLLYLPFIAIDLVVSNILLAMGMMMVSPMTISLPFKLLIFILMGGWEKLVGQLMISFS
ncbi:type III secretion system export apparatus subunit SctR [uncultured Shewanella sp.]|uniref:type III secretion system export apparatus subunit SctR n=1 Tax=uncultured Shewanella sp. TaxID=173975 RepID=UPI0026045BA2|nr:type III secretion system export apparatus subunit SctR [uncultured Shewanella sp.]